jgi:hypothetical protein
LLGSEASAIANKPNADAFAHMAGSPFEIDIDACPTHLRRQVFTDRNFKFQTQAV